MRFFSSFFALLVLMASGPAIAQKVNFDLGFYSFDAKPPQDSVGASSESIKLSGLGSYSISANFEFLKPFELGVGYTVFYSNVISGDMGFGPDLYLHYFPFNEGSGLRASFPGINYREIEAYRPFGFIAFHQRQFQSVQSAYSGYGFGLGLETQIKDRLSIRSTLRHMSMVGPSQSEFVFSDLTLGLQFQFD